MRNKTSTLLVVMAVIGFASGCTDKNRDLVMAAADGDVAKVQQLIEKGADATGKSGWKPILPAAGSGNVEVMKLLLAAGANADEEDKYSGGAHPIHWAAMNGHLEAVKFLLANGAKSSVKNANGETPSVIAAKFKHPELAAFLKAQELKEASEGMVKLVVPQVDDPIVDLPSDVPRLIVSVAAANGAISKVFIGDLEISSADSWAALTKVVANVKARRTKGMNEQDAKKFEVLLRSDLSLPYAQVRPIMNAISKAGIENVNLMAYKPEAAELPPSK